MNDASLTGIEEFLHAQIPLTAAMGVKVESWDQERLILTAPLEPNHNHLGTAFGGSLAVLATLAGYSLLWLQLGDRNAHVVVRKSSIDYLRPVHGELRAICAIPSPEAFAAFQATFAKAGKARLWLDVTIEEKGAVCMTYRGLFVALR